jgi:hypothetical protein
MPLIFLAFQFSGRQFEIGAIETIGRFGTLTTNAVRGR